MRSSFDIDLPADYDDEYWGMPSALQPRGKPSTSAWLVSYSQLMLIFGRIQGAIVQSLLSCPTDF